MRIRGLSLRWLLSIPGTRKRYIVYLTLAQALLGGSGVLYALLMRNIVDAATAHDVGSFWREMGAICVLVIAQIAIRAFIRWLNELSKATIENALKKRLTATLMRKDYLRISAIHSAEWLNRLTNDTVVVSTNAVEILPGLAGMLVKLVSAIIMIIVLEPRFAAIIVPGGAAMMLFTWQFRRILKNMHKSVQEADGSLRTLLQERIGSMIIIRSFAAEAQTLDDVNGRLDTHKASRMRRTRFSNLCNIGFAAAMNGMYILGIGWCGYGILKGTISFGTLTAITQLIAQIQAPFANITGYLPRYFALAASAERLMEAESFEEDGNAPLPLSKILALYHNRIDSFGLRDTSFSYLPTGQGSDRQARDLMPEVLQSISLEVKKGEYVAFTGQSGCGKSTALKLLMCVLRIDSGSRYYRDSSGTEHPLTGAHRRLFAYVPQGNALMSGTIRQVVSLAEPEAASDDQRIHNALQVACAEEFVSELEDGIDTQLGERGGGLSEGQTQRLAIARAIFAESPILLLDEATSSLDEPTELRLLDNLKKLTNKTVLIVTHRPAALSICDRVLQFTEEGMVERHA